MQLGMVGLGRMGANIVRRLVRDGHTCVVFDVNADAVSALAAESDAIVGAADLADFVAKLEVPRAAWVMVPAAHAGGTVHDLAALMTPGDIVIDGGNTYYRDDIDRAEALAPAGVHYVDVGTSGGVFGLERGFCLMIGGEDEAVRRLEPIFCTMAPGAGDLERTPGRTGALTPEEQGYLHCGPVGSGHFVKMVHNGIEYGLMQAFAEGFDILRNANSPDLPAQHRFDLDTADIAEVWRRGSVVTSWLLDLCAMALAQDSKLSAFSGFVQDSGEGRWTVEAAIAEAVPAPVLTSALYARFRSRIGESYADKLLSAMRKGFGGHVEPAVPARPEREP